MESEEFRLLGCYETGHAIMGWQYASNAVMLRLVSFGLMATSLLALILGNLTTSPEKPTGPNQTGQKLMAPSLSHGGSLLGSYPAARGRLEVLFIEQKFYENS